MKLLVIGNNGLVGREIVRRAEHEGFDVCVPPTDFDIRSASSVEALLRACMPDAIVNAAAKINVEWCEENEAEALQINAGGPRLLLETVARHERKPLFVHLSTSEVFGKGKGRRQVNEQPEPVNAYGRTKRAGEEIVLGFAASHNIIAYVVRAGWLYGEGRDTFVDVVAKALLAGKRISVIVDQYNIPVWTRDLADGILYLVRTRPPSGIFHFSSVANDMPSRFMIAEEIAHALGKSASDLDKAYKKDILKVQRSDEGALVHSREFPECEWKRSLRSYLKERYGE